MSTITQFAIIIIVGHGTYNNQLASFDSASLKVRKVQHDDPLLRKNDNVDTYHRAVKQKQSIIKNNEKQNTIKGIGAIAISPDGSAIAAAVFDGPVCEWDITKPNATPRTISTVSNGYSVSYSSDGKFIATTVGELTDYSHVIFLDRTQKIEKYFLPISDLSIGTSVAFSRDLKFIATGARHTKMGYMIILDSPVVRRYDEKIELWQYDDIKKFPLKTVKPGDPLIKEFRDSGSVSHFTNEIFAVAFSSDSKLLITAGQGRSVKDRIWLWDTNNGTLVRQIAPGNRPIVAISVSPTQPLIATTSSRYVDLYLKKQLLSQNFNYFSNLRKSSFLRNTRRVSSRIELWNLKTGKSEGLLKGHEWDVIDCKFSPDGKYLASASLDKTVRIWDVKQKKLVTTLKDHTDCVYSVAFTPDGKILASAGSDGRVLLWDFQAAIKQKPQKPRILKQLPVAKKK